MLLAAGVLSAGGVGTILTWSATANQRPAALNGTTDSVESDATIDLDSLYIAKAAESTPGDSSYVTPVAPRQHISGRISWYGPGFHGRRTASGERFDRQEMTAAHRTLPFGSLVRVTDEHTGKSVLVRINDRGPFCRGRVLDLSEGAATRLGIRGKGTASVKAEVYETAPSVAGNAMRVYDIDGRMLTLHGYSVVVKRDLDFDEAIALQQSLNAQGYKDVFLAPRGSRYDIYVGLFSSAISSESLAAELADAYVGAEVIHFDNGRSIAATVDTTARTL